MRRWSENDGKMMEDDGKMMWRIWPLIIPSTMDLSNKWPFQTKHPYISLWHISPLPSGWNHQPSIIHWHLSQTIQTTEIQDFHIISFDLFTMNLSPSQLKTPEVSTVCWAPTSAARPPWCAPSPTSSWRASPSATSWSLSSWSTRSRTRRSHHGATGGPRGPWGHRFGGWLEVLSRKLGRLI